MVRPINSSAIPHPPHRQPSSPVSSPSTQEAGKPSQHAVGQQAKAVISQAVQKAVISQAVQGEELPKNIQGKVASALARGLPLESIITLQEPSEPVVDAGPVIDVPVDTVVDEGAAGEPVVEGSVAVAPEETPVSPELDGAPVVEAEPIELPLAEAPLPDPELVDLLPDNEETGLT